MFRTGIVMLVLSTQALCGDTDLQATMKSPVQFFITTLAAAMGLTIVGCGGGGNGSEVTVIQKTVTVVASGLNGAKHMVFSGGNLFVAVQGNRLIKNITTGQVFFQDNTNTLEPIGLTVNGSDLIWTSSTDGIYKNTTNVISGGNWYGLGILNQRLYAAGNSPSQILTYYISDPNPANVDFSQVDAGSIPTRTITEGSVQGIGVFGSDIYVTVTNSGIPNNNVVIKLSTSSAPYYQVMSSWGIFSQPNAIVFDGNYAYIANYGTAGTGDGGYISRKYMLDNSPAERYMDATKGNWGNLTPGFCGLAGLAVSNGYLYASNGSCSSGSNAGSILKIKL
jgi:hypothetical protein